MNFQATTSVVLLLFLGVTTERITCGINTCDKDALSNAICRVSFVDKKLPALCDNWKTCYEECAVMPQICGCSFNENMTKEDWAQEIKHILTPLECYYNVSYPNSFQIPIKCSQTIHHMAKCVIQKIPFPEAPSRVKVFKMCVNYDNYCDAKDTCCCEVDGCNFNMTQCGRYKGSTTVQPSTKTRKPTWPMMPTTTEIPLISAAMAKHPPQDGVYEFRTIIFGSVVAVIMAVIMAD